MSKTPHPFMSIAVSEFRHAVGHLTIPQEGAYNRLIQLAWVTPGCSLPIDHAWIRHRLGADEATYDGLVREVLAEFFKPVRGRLVYAGLKKKYDDVTVKRATRAEAGKRGGLAKALKTNKKVGSNATVLLQQLESELEKKESPLPPKGAEQLELTTVEDEVETGVTDADVASIWTITPKEARLRTSREDIRRALVAAFRRGGPPSQVRIALEAYYNAPRQIEDGRKYAAGAHRIINNDRWKEHYVQTLATRAAGPPDPMDIWRRRMREWTTNEWWPGDWGPRPGRTGCEVPAPVLRESGYEPAALAAVVDREAS